LSAGKESHASAVTDEAPLYENVWRSGGIASPFLTSALGGGEWSASYSGCFTQRNRPSFAMNKRLSGSLEPVWPLWRRERSEPDPDSCDVQPVG
jgi:hypothetical protein